VKPKWLGYATLFLLLLLPYVYVFPRWADPNQNSRLDMIVAVVEDHTFQIDKYVANTVDYAKVGEHYYSDKAPGAAILGIPVYAGLKLVLDTPLMDKVMQRLAANPAFVATLRVEGSGLLVQKVRFALALVVIALVVGAVPSALLGVLLYLALAHFTPRPGVRLVVVVGYSLLTPALAYANTLYGHQLSAALLFGAYYLVLAAARPLSRTRLLAVGFLLAYAVVTEYPAVLISGIIFGYTVYRLVREGQWRRFGWMLPTGLAVGGAWLAYNTVVFGGPLKLGYSYSEQWATVHSTGFMSLTWPHADALWGITFGPFRGVFVLSPLLLLAVPGFVLWWRTGEQRAAFWVALASTVAIFLFNASSAMWWGGFAVGPRYILPGLPFMALALVFVVRDWGGQLIGRVVIGLLYVWSTVATWGLTLAEQAFPPGADLHPNPLVDYAWPNWLIGNIARNAGTLLRLRGPLSLLPLGVGLVLLGLIWWRLSVASSVKGGGRATV
jgi:hypothetical protein